MGFKAATKTIEHMGGINRMADDGMRNDESQRNMGTKDDQDFKRQSPGRGGQVGQQGGQHAGSKQGGQFGGQKGSRNLDEDDDIGTGSSRQPSGQNRGGQNR